MNANLSLALRATAKRVLRVKSWNSDEDHKRLVPAPRVIFDIGANVGQTVDRYRRLYPSAGIYCFEPVPSTFAELKRHTARDPLTRCFQIAFCDQVSTATMNIQRTHSGGNSLLQPVEAGRTTSRIQVPTATIDAFCEKEGIFGVDILKVDAEGAEQSIFRGAARMFSRRAIRFVFMEVCFRPQYVGMALFQDLDADLKRAGFRLYRLYACIT